MGNKAIQATIGGETIENKKINLLDKFFEIPAYQRLYEWESTQIEELLNDIKKACDESKEQYFIGNITTSKKGDSFVLIDGQQRLTTLWFIGFYLASKKCGEWDNFIAQDDKLRIAMPIRENEEKALIELANNIADKENLAQSLLGKDIYQNIFNAFKCIESWFVSGNGKDIDLAKFAKYIYESVCFVFVELAENTDLNRFFVRMNNRGKQLEKHEILKARILDKIKDDKSDEWQKYAKIWDLCSDMNKYIFQSASDRNFLNSENEGGEKWGIDTIIGEFNERNAKGAQNDDTPDKVESIIDFPTFLLHCYKLYSQDNNVPITQDKLLENFNLSKMDSESCKIFIKSMLYYRVLFDYFVIKNNAEQGNGFRIRRLYPDTKNKTTYYRLPEDSKSVADSPLHNLAMVQNYLRVARQGDRQNYHHWLTPFLKFLHKSELINYDCIKPEMWNPDEICKTFAKNDESKQDDLVKFLEILDTNLAIARLSGDENSLLDETNKAIQQAQNLQPKTLGNVDLDSLLNKLNNGTRTPHYWFYRLEYYLWKNKQKFADIKFSGQSFENIADKFYFRNLNSVEHIQPQSRAEEKDWQIHNKGTKDEKRDIDCFGNLALLSVGFNSSLSNQDNADKRLDLQKKINKSDVESLKLWLVYANYPKDEDWTYANAQVHQEQMIDILIKSLKSSQ